MEKADGYSRKSFHRICMVVLTALFAALIAVLLLQDDVDEAALLHTAVCAMIMLLDIVLAVGYSSGHYNTSSLQDQVYMMLLMLVSVSLLVLGVYRLAFFGSAYYFLEPFIVLVVQEGLPTRAFAAADCKGGAKLSAPPFASHTRMYVTGSDYQASLLQQLLPLSTVAAQD